MPIFTNLNKNSSKKKTLIGASCPILVKNYPLKVRLTQRGAFCACLLIIMILGSLNYNNNMALLVTLSFLSMFIVSSGLAFRYLSSLTLVDIQSEPAFAGDSVQFKIKIESLLSNWPASIHIDKNQCIYSIGLFEKPNDHLFISIKETCRGSISLGDITIYSDYPFGIIRCTAQLLIKNNCWIYPKVIAHQITTDSATTEQQLATLKSNGNEFLGIRKYQLGDPLKHISWKSSAKLDTLMATEYASNMRSIATFDLASYADLSLEDSLSHLCYCIVQANEQSIPYQIKLNEYASNVGFGKQHLEACLIQLAAYPTTADNTTRQ